MIRLSEKQMNALESQAIALFPDRVLAHWHEQLPRLVACFSESELTMIARKTVELGMADPGHSEASVVLGADLWLHELAQRRGFKQ